MSKALDAIWTLPAAREHSVEQTRRVAHWLLFGKGALFPAQTSVILELTQAATVFLSFSLDEWLFT